VPLARGVTEPMPGWISTVAALRDSHVSVTVPPRVMVDASARSVTVGAGSAGAGGVTAVVVAGGGGGGAGVFLQATETIVMTVRRNAADCQESDRFIPVTSKFT
jgi:hypothetical protein